MLTSTSRAVAEIEGAVGEPGGSRVPLDDLDVLEAAFGNELARERDRVRASLDADDAAGRPHP